MAKNTSGTNVGGKHTTTVPKATKAPDSPKTPWLEKAKEWQSNFHGDGKSAPKRPNDPKVKDQGNVISGDGQVQESSTTSTAESTAANSQTFVISETEIAMMRGKTIAFHAEGLKPNTRYYPFFDDVYVGDYCTEIDSPAVDAVTGRVINSIDKVLISNDLGDIVGNFFMPGNTFSAGSHTFRLVDAVEANGDTFIATPHYGLAEATYEAHGVLKQLQTQVTEVVTEPDPVLPIVDPVPPTPTPEDPTPPPVVVPTPVTVCQEWFFDYKIVRTETRTMTVTTNSATPPDVSTLSPAAGGRDTPGVVGKLKTNSSIANEGPTYAAGSLTYVSTTSRNQSNAISNFLARVSPTDSSLALNPNYTYEYASIPKASSTDKRVVYDHVFSYTGYIPTEGNRSYRQSWVGTLDQNGDIALPDITNFRPSGLTDGQTITKIPGPDGNVWQKLGNVACPANKAYGFKTPVRQDPLAQSFFIDAAIYPRGMFTTAIAVYFKNVDQTSPVSLELREMSNGLPGSNILPGGQCFLQGFETGSSIDASIPTIFRFDSPIYLRPSTDYCFVLKSSSMGYNAWCSRVGEVDVTTNTAIDDQAFNGTLFKSENDVTWIPDPYEDIKFDLFKATFDASITGKLHFDLDGDTLAGAISLGNRLSSVGNPSSVYWGTEQVLPMSFISTTKGSHVVKINIPMHGLQDGEKIKIDGINPPSPSDAYNGLTDDDLNIVHNNINVVDEDHVEISVVSQATKSGNIQVSDLYTLVNNQPALMAAMMPAQQSLAFVDYSTFSPTVLMSDETITAGIANRENRYVPQIFSSTSFKVYTNIVVNEAMVDYMATELDGTSLVESLTLVDDSYNLQTVNVDYNDSFKILPQPYKVVSHDNEGEVGAVGSAFDITVEMKTDNRDISPVIGLQGASLMVRSYKIDNQGGELTGLIAKSDLNDSAQNSEIKSGSGNAAAKYKSTINMMDKVYNNLTIYVTGTCPSPAAMDVYLRTSTDKETHLDLDWQWVPLEGVYGTAFTPSDINEITEWKYVITTDELFNVFDVKVVMRSTNSSIVPKIYGIRSIANNV